MVMDIVNSYGRVRETVARSSQREMVEPKVSFAVRPRGGNQYVNLRWLLNSDVY